MTNTSLKSIDEYEQCLSEKVEAWSAGQRLALAAAMAERWLPAYEAFSVAENWGDAPGLRRCLDAIWGHLLGRTLTAADRARYSGMVDDVTPHMDDSDDTAALAACIILQQALDCCTDENAASAVQAVLSGFEAVEPDWMMDEDAQPRLWKKSAIRQEVKDQLGLVEQISKITIFDEQAIKSLRDSMARTRRPAKKPAKPKTPPAMTNQAAFEQHRRFVENDIKNRRNVEIVGNPLAFAMMLVSEWLGRYSRRLDLVTGNFGRLADTTGLNALAERQRARDITETALPDWDPTLRKMVDMCLQHCCMAKRVDAASVQEPHCCGPSLRFLWAEAARRGRHGNSAWEYVVAWARHRPTAWEVEDRRKKKGLAHAVAELGEHLARTVAWTGTGDPEYPWAAEVDGETWRVRVNDFPDHYMYSLEIAGAIVGDFHDWPETWGR